MASKKKLLQAAAGSAGGAAALNVEDVFSTYLYEGTGSNNYIKNDINLGDGAKENTVLHLTGDTLNDSSPFNHTMTAVGNTSVNTSTKKYGTGSIYFDGTGDYLRAEDSRFVLGSYDFTIEFWLNLPDASPTKGIFHIWDGSNTSNYSIAIYHIGNDLTLQFKNGINSTPNGSISSNTDVISNNTWHHIAAVRYNNTIKLYVDGTAVSGGFDATGINLVMSYLELGTHWDSAYTFTGYIDDFRITRGTARYTSNFTAPTAALPLDVSTTGEGGLVWIKNRGGTFSHDLEDTERGAGVWLESNSTNAETDLSGSYGISSFNSNGFSVIGGGGRSNVSGNDFASWTFRKAPKFFDVITYSGNGSNQTISHNLGSTPGMIVVKARNNSDDAWYVWHRSLPQFGTQAQYRSVVFLDSTSAYSNYSIQTAQPDNSNIYVGSAWSVSGYDYVMYVFAHNDGDGEFGPDGDADIIKCGTCSGETGSNRDIDLGFEPQFIITKAVDTTGDWRIVDNMRGFLASGTGVRLVANTSNAEASDDTIHVRSTGFYVNGLPGSGNYIYIAIRRGPMAVPTDATDVFDVAERGADSPPPLYRSGFVTDMFINRADVTLGGNNYVLDRLRGQVQVLMTDASDAEAAYGGALYGFDVMDGIGNFTGLDSNNYSWMWKRAPNYFDVVAYTGNNTAGNTISHNLGVVPEMMWIKSRSNAVNWIVYHKDLNGSTNPEDYYLRLNGTSAETNDSSGDFFNSTAPTATNFTLGGSYWVNGTSNIAYLFASLDGVSKVGSYTGNDGTQNIDCGFSSGARFVLIKKSSNLGSWTVYDTERGIVAGNDAKLLLNSTAAETSSSDDIDPYSAGFTVNQAAASLNSNGQTYIFYAIA